MKHLLIAIFCFCGLFSMAQESQNITVLANWDDNTLPSNNFANFQYNDIWGYTDSEGREFAILGNETWVIFLEVTDPTNPTEMTRIAPGSSSLWRDFKTYGHYGYGTMENGEGLTIFDLSDIHNGNVTYTQNTSHFTSAHNLFIDENGKIYVCGANSGLIVYDAAINGNNPVFVANVDLSPWGGYVHDLFVQNNKAYCSSGGSGLYIYDLNNINNPVLLGSVTNYPEQGYNHNVWVTPDEQYMVWTDETFNTGVKLADISDLTDINITDIFRSALEAPVATNSIAHNAFIRDNLIILSYYDDGVQIFDMTDPTDVQQVAWYDTYPDNNGFYNEDGCWGVYPFFESGNIISSDGKYGLHVLSTSLINVGTNNVETLDAGIYPNLIRASQNIQVNFNSLPETDIDIQLINLIGQTVSHVTYEPNQQVIFSSPEDLTRGMYLIQVAADGKQISQKLTVQ